MTRRATAAAVVAALAVVAGAVALWPRQEKLHLTADFVRAVGLFPGSDVRVLGVHVGTVTSVEPRGSAVRVGLEVEAPYGIPADARAAVVAPSLVSDRYVQLLPAWTDGPRMRDGANIPLERTAVPVELDRVTQSLDDLVVALGPTGANRQGSLDRLLDTGARNLDGNGQNLHDLNADLSDAVHTFAQGRGDLFSTVRNLDEFSAMLARGDEQVRRLNGNLATVSTELDAERDDLAGALRNLGTALDEVGSFVKDNRALLTDDVHRLTEVTGSVAAERDALAETLDNAPVALSNLQLAYNESSGTLDTRTNVEGVDNPGLILCSLVTGPTGTGNSDLCKALALVNPDGRTLLDGVGLGGADPTLGGLLP